MPAQMPSIHRWSKNWWIRAKLAKVTLVIDNLQDGKDAGKAIAEELGAKQINLSNFPGGFENTETWEKAIDRNVELLIQAIAQ